jgi:hypothetical protein
MDDRPMLAEPSPKHKIPLMKAGYGRVGARKLLSPR